MHYSVCSSNFDNLSVAWLQSHDKSVSVEKHAESNAISHLLIYHPKPYGDMEVWRYVNFPQLLYEILGV